MNQRLGLFSGLGAYFLPPAIDLSARGLRNSVFSAKARVPISFKAESGILWSFS
jgi:hypothetical protein